MTALILVVGTLLFWLSSPGQDDFSNHLHAHHERLVECGILDGRGIRKPQTSAYMEDQGGTFDTFVECRRHFLVNEQPRDNQGELLAQLSHLADDVAEHLHQVQPQSTWVIRQTSSTAVIGEKIFAVFADSMNRHGLRIKHQPMEGTELCPDTSGDPQILLIVHENDRGLKIGRCKNHEAVWWWHE